MNAQYRHSQPGYLSIVISLVLIVAGAIIYAYGPRQPGELLAAIGALCLVLTYKLTVEINNDFLRFWFGPGIFWKTIPVERITYCQPFKGVICGWGIRITPDGWLYNVSGMKAVTIVLKSGKKLNIGTDEPIRLIEAINSVLRGTAGDETSQTWAEVKTDYLKRVEQALSTARHPRSFEILADVDGHLDRRFTELEPNQQTWENFQKIVTEMGPPSDYAELVTGVEKISRWTLTKLELAAIALLTVAFFGSIYSYPQLPEKMAIHWDFRGQVDGYMSKSAGLFLMPGILAAIAVIIVVVPRVASVWANIEGFRKFFGSLAVLLSVFMSLAHYQMILWNLGIKINPAVVAIPMTAGILIWMAVWSCWTHQKSRNTKL
jgi:uncharacterized membrane protein